MIPTSPQPPPPPEREPLGAGWIFQRGGEVYGPVPEARLRELLYAGEVDGDTPISADGERYRPLRELAGLVVDLHRAEAQRRVDLEVAAARRREIRRRGLMVATTAVLGLGALGGGAWLAIRRPWQPRSALLEEFGPGITVAAPVRIGQAREPPAAEEPERVEVPVPQAGPVQLPPGLRPRPSARPPPRAEAGLVEARWNRADLQEVVARERRTLAPCLREEAARSPDFAGEVPMEFAVGTDGRVAALWIDEPRFRSGPLRDCLARQLAAWRFRPFTGQQPVLSLSFRIGAP